MGLALSFRVGSGREEVGQALTSSSLWFCVHAHGMFYRLCNCHCVWLNPLGSQCWVEAIGKLSEYRAENSRASKQGIDRNLISTLTSTREPSARRV